MHFNLNSKCCRTASYSLSRLRVLVAGSTSTSEDPIEFEWEVSLVGRWYIATFPSYLQFFQRLASL